MGNNKNERIVFVCNYCGGKASDKPSSFKRKTRHFCSMNCYSKFRAEQLPKEEQHRFGTGHTDEERAKRRKARSILNHHLRDNQIERPPCELCGDKAEAHHEDYNNPLDVRWLCFKHHREAHRVYENPELLTQGSMIPEAAHPLFIQLKPLIKYVN